MKKLSYENPVPSQGNAGECRKMQENVVECRKLPGDHGQEERRKRRKP